MRPLRYFEPGVGSHPNIAGLARHLQIPHANRTQAEMYRAHIRVLKRQWGKHWWRFAR
jgi:hypothetical protein